MATIEQQIYIRFTEVIAEHVGPGKKYRFKKAFASAIGMLPQELHRIEIRVGELQYRHIVAIHKKLGIDLNWFVAGTIVRPKVADIRIEKTRQTIKKMAEQI